MRKWSHRIRAAEVELEGQTADISRVIDELGATPKVVRAAIGRALMPMSFRSLT